MIRFVYKMPYGIVVGVDGQSDTAAQQYAKGLLKSTGTICIKYNH